MKRITESPEHHFLATLEAIGESPSCWSAMHFALSRKLEHDAIVKSPEQIRERIQALKDEAETLAHEITVKGSAAALEHATLYVFADGDVIFLARPESEEEYLRMNDLYYELEQKVGPDISTFDDLNRALYAYQKIADQRMIGEQKFGAYHAMADANRIASIPLRRERRDEHLILIVEDDRFTASYAANILSKQYEIVHARTGEDGVKFYIEHAPDLVFLDIHLPGMSGHDTLQALKTIDPKAFVIMLSADTAKDNVLFASNEGAAGFLKKPFSKDRMLQATLRSPFIRGGQPPSSPSKN